ncbi:MAG: pantetheine-phosphate adenylyltransferase [Alphaproteobacteria bacterium]
MSEPRTGVYPGTFDPTTNGHLDIIWRALRAVDRLIVAVAVHAEKETLFDVDERVEMMREEVATLDRSEAGRIEVHAFDTLLMDFVQSIGASVIIRGLRAVSDFEYEFQMTGMNRRLNPDVETVFLMASEAHQFIASRLIKEIARLDGDISPFVSPRVAQRLAERIAERRRPRK